MAEIDHARFAADFAARLHELGYSLSKACQKWPATDRAMLSRAANAKTLSAGNYLLLCDMAGLEPYAYLQRAKGRRLTLEAIRKQAVTRAVARETRKAGEGMSCALGR